MDERCAQLLGQIISAEKPIKISELAKFFKVSSRTIRYDLDKIDDFLKTNELPQLIRKPNSGISYFPLLHQRQKITTLLEEINSYNYVLTPQERKTIILTELFQAKDYTTIDEIASILSVSRGTVVNDLKGVRKWLLKYGLQLESLPRFGMRIKGREQNLRRAAISLLSENMEIEKALNFIKAPIHRRINIVANQQIKKLFQDLDVLPIEKSIQLAEKQLKTTFADNAYSGLVIHLALAIKRIQLDKNIIMPEDELSKLKFTKEFAVASSMVTFLEQSYNIRIPTDEIGYVTIHLLGGKVTESDIFASQEWLQLQVLTNDIIKAIGEKLDIDFLLDGELYNGLLKHLEPTIYRLKHNLPLKNPILKEIKYNYPKIFKAVRSSLKPIEDYVGHKIPDEEAGFIAIHIGAALERNKPASSSVYNAVVVCGTGVGTAKLLSSRIESQFSNINVIDTVASRQVAEVSKNRKVDLIISTVPTGCKDIPEIIVNPLLPEEDIEKMHKLLIKISPKDSIGADAQTQIENLLEIIDKYCFIKDRLNLVNELSKFLNLTNHIDSKGVARPVLKDLLTEKTIKLNVEASNWEEAIRKGGELLVQEDFVEPSYVEAMIRNVKELGPYIVIAPGIAMPHARPEDGVKKVCMSLITLKGPVSFDNKEPVKLILTFGATDHHTHLQALSDLMRLFSNSSSIDAILQASEVKEVIDVIELSATGIQ